MACLNLAMSFSRVSISSFLVTPQEVERRIDGGGAAEGGEVDGQFIQVEEDVVGQGAGLEWRRDGVQRITRIEGIRLIKTPRVTCALYVMMGDQDEFVQRDLALLVAKNEEIIEKMAREMKRLSTVGDDTCSPDALRFLWAQKRGHPEHAGGPDDGGG